MAKHKFLNILQLLDQKKILNKEDFRLELALSSPKLEEEAA